MRRSGFSLVELSIVLVILGLLVGGILAGQSLIRAAELRGVTASVTQYKTALNAFRDKYFGLPGDIINATNIFSACTDVANNPCNGNADGIIQNISGTQAEELRLWQQLTLAGLVEGSFTGLDSTPHFVPGTNIPRARIANAAHRIATTGAYGKSGTAITFSNPSSNTTYWQYVIPPNEAWNLDTKMDDGRADNGKVLTVNGSNSSGTAATTCVSSASQWVGPASYTLATPDAFCAMIFYL